MIMDIEYAKKVLNALSDGVNPITGEILPDTDSSNQPEVIRALHAVLNALESTAFSSKKPRPENAGKPWSAEEDDALREEYRQGLKASEIAKLHVRSRGAITSRLVRIGEASNPYEIV